MKVSKFLPMVLFLGVLSFSSCNDDDDDEDPTPPTRTEMLTAKNWMVEGWNIEPAIDIDNNGTQENNLIPFIEACNLDDFFDFNTDGSYTIEEGASKCDPNDPTIVESGDWLWNSDNTRLIFEASGGTTTEAEVISISKTEMVVEFTSVQQGVTYTQTQTWN
ncbi:MAG TPA: lipocalin family protein [Cryomorphaceae bacterium]|nr:lipocalin family protein [Cryomorphaceae bacterium]